VAYCLGGTKEEILSAIDKEVFQQFQEHRDDLSVVHDIDIKKFAINAAGEYPLFDFKASAKWIANWKKKQRITSRKVQKLKKPNTYRSEQEIQQSIETFRSEFKNNVISYDPANVWNTDQIGFAYEIVSGRTLSFKGERWTLGSAYSPKNRVTHSYTVQYIISLEGHIVGDAFVVLQVIH